MPPKSPQLFLNFQELDELIPKILNPHPFGLPATKIRKDLPVSYRCPIQQLTVRLEDLADKRRLYKWSPSSTKTPKPPPAIYSLEPLEQAIRSRTRELLSSRDLTPAEIKKNFPAHIGPLLPYILNTLTQQGEVKWHPPRKGKRLSIHEADPGKFLSREIKKVFEKGEMMGFSGKAILGALHQYAQIEERTSVSMLDAEGMIFQKMKELEPASVRGALVYIPKLRKALEDRLPDKRAFDEVILSLAGQGMVQLQSHSRPGELTKDERDALIDNGRGSYFMAIGIRME